MQGYLKMILRVFIHTAVRTAAVVQNITNVQTTNDIYIHSGGRYYERKTILHQGYADARGSEKVCQDENSVGITAEQALGERD
jgi:hypothetical protein